MKQRRILFIAPTRIGDAILATSVLAHILNTEPGALVTVVTSPLSAPLFGGYPKLERMIAITKQSYNRHWMKVWKQVVGTHWHAVWDIRNSAISHLVRSKARHGYSKQKLAAPKVKQYEKAFGIPSLPAPMLWPRAEDESLAASLLPKTTRYLIFAPMANWAPKEWPLTHYITLARTLLEGAYAGYRPIIICAANERERAAPMVADLAAYNPIDLTDGTMPLLALYAIMQRAQGFFGNDSGLMHMAFAAGTPTIGLFGPTPNISDTAPHVRFLYAPNDDLTQLAPATVVTCFEALTASKPL